MLQFEKRYQLWTQKGSTDTWAFKEFDTIEKLIIHKKHCKDFYITERVRCVVDGEKEVETVVLEDDAVTMDTLMGGGCANRGAD